MLSFKRVNIAAITFIVFILILAQNEFVSYFWIVAVIFIWIVFTAYGSLEIRKNYFLKAHHQNPSINDNVVALTFDDGPNKKYTNKVLQLLKKYNAKATFFCIGEQVEKHPELLTKIISEGHIIGNHSYSHSHSFGFFSMQKVTNDLNKNDNLLEKVTGLKCLFFRPPIGVTNPNIAQAVKKMNLQTFGWSIRSFDTIAKKPAKVVQSVREKVKKGDVILLHDTSEISIQILEGILQYLEQQNMKSVTLEKLFGIDAYKN